jgi:hypothetical protein
MPSYSPAARFMSRTWLAICTPEPIASAGLGGGAAGVNWPTVAWYQRFCGLAGLRAAVEVADGTGPRKGGGAAGCWAGAGAAAGWPGAAGMGPAGRAVDCGGLPREPPTPGGGMGWTPPAAWVGVWAKANLAVNSARWSRRAACLSLSSTCRGSFLPLGVWACQRRAMAGWWVHM